MFKKTLLSALFAVSTMATAQINLDFTMTLTTSLNQQQATGAVVVDQDTTASIVFDGLDALIVDIYTQVNDDIVDLHVQFFQKMENDELVPATERFNVQVPFAQVATITVQDTDNIGSLVLAITPTFVE
jgi:hypothetical protein